METSDFPSRLVLFGATGDLAARYLFPALGALAEHGLLPDPFHLTGVGSSERSDDDLREQVAEALEGAGVDDAIRKRLVEQVRYRVASVDDGDAVREAVESTPGEGPVIAYLALPPGTYADALRALADAKLPDGSRIVIEKPFGEGLDSARELNELIDEFFDESSIYRVDHFVAKTTIQNILGLRFANRIFEPIWSNQHVEKVEIVFDETLELEGRAKYYDDAGALVDMIQNHLMQLLCLVAMDPPASLDGEDLRDRKVSVLRSIRPPAPGQTIRGRYAGYADEEGVDPSKETETFAQVTLFVDSWRWAGVPFLLRSGKALEADKQEITVTFKDVPHLAWGQDEQPVQNVLRLRLDSSPEQLHLSLNANGGDDLFDLAPLTMTSKLHAAELPAYAHVFLNVLKGDSTLSVRGDEAEEAWRIVDPVRDAWKAGEVELLEYERGSSGPA
ncbi:MAG TPA: glucose-6-phosphate dehydrogenase [Acidimicrobiales bacterium]|nr:glucose-6-phosphate dehydrogenase [Acidimicrobiales bacterium]